MQTQQTLVAVAIVAVVVAKWERTKYVQQVKLEVSKFQGKTEQKSTSRQACSQAGEM